jgi:predicted oxidoreductase
LQFAELKKQLLSRRLVNASDILGGTHCLAPACIRASVASSLAKLRIDTLDLLYLHNAAEVQLEARGKEGFFEMLRVAFKVWLSGVFVDRGCHHQKEAAIIQLEALCDNTLNDYCTHVIVPC